MTHDDIIARLDEARERTLLLVDPVSEEDLHRQHDVLMSPIVWDLGHIAHFEELWLVRNLEGPVEFGEMPGIFNPFENPRRVRGSLDLPSLAECRDLMAEIRARVLRRLSNVRFDGDNPLLRDGYVYSMVLQHEYQHDETILQTLQLKQGAPYRAPRLYEVASARHRATSGPMVRFGGGSVCIGTGDRSSAYDNERPMHAVQMAPFSIDVFPVTNGDYLQFMGDGGYTRRELWSDAGWEWLSAAKVDSPKYWTRDGTDWTVRFMDKVMSVPLDHPVCHVCYHEAEAFARFAGKRLPTEQEWEVAAGWDASSGTMRAFPWGGEAPSAARANIDQLAFSTAPVGSYEFNWSPIGCYGMLGDVWEWTSSDSAISETIGSTVVDGKSRSIDALVWRRNSSLTSTGMYVAPSVRCCIARNRILVFVALPAPSSTSVRAAEISTILAASAVRISVSARVR